jgi:glycosyltransferase involved in cell wall biosynthesis
MTKSIKVSAIVSCFNGIKYLPVFLENCAGQTIKDRLEIVLVHNQPSEEDLAVVKKFQDLHPGLVTHIVVPREPLAVSTNRALLAAGGEYVCIWNVDDLRTPNSLELMVKTLDENPNVGFTYGDYTIFHKWPVMANLDLEKIQGKNITVPEFEKKEFSRSMFLGPFYMWRKSLCPTLGYWDEQFKSGADFDHSIRLALASQGKKTIGLLGYYLDEGLGLSTGKTPWQPIERTVIELRYGIYSKLDFWYYNRAKKYRLFEVLQNGSWVPLKSLSPNYGQFAEGKGQMFYAIIKYPFWVVKRVIKYTIKKLFRR